MKVYKGHQDEDQNERKKKKREQKGTNGNGCRSSKRLHESIPIVSLQVLRGLDKCVQVGSDELEETKTNNHVCVQVQRVATAKENVGLVCEPQHVNDRLHNFWEDV
jgi:hypothetical protein